jgi:hypothetical protein
MPPYPANLLHSVGPYVAIAGAAYLLRLILPISSSSLSDTLSNLPGEMRALIRACWLLFPSALLYLYWSGDVRGSSWGMQHTFAAKGVMILSILAFVTGLLLFLVWFPEVKVGEESGKA